MGKFLHLKSNNFVAIDKKGFTTLSVTPLFFDGPAWLGHAAPSLGNTLYLQLPQENYNVLLFLLVEAELLHEVEELHCIFKGKQPAIVQVWR